MTTKELFDSKIPAALATRGDKAREINAVFLFKITGDDGGEWTVDLKADKPTCTPGASGTPNCTIEVSERDFQTMLTNPAAGMQLYFTGKLKVSGDAMLATKLQTLFTLAA